MENPPSDTLRAMILRRGLVVSMSVLLVVCAVLISCFAVNLHRHVNRDINRVAMDYQNLADRFFQDKIAVLQLIIGSVSLESLVSPGYLDRLCSLVQSSTRAFVDLGVVDGLGNLVAVAGPRDLGGKKCADEAWFQEAMHTGVYVSDVFPGFRGLPHLVVALKRSDAGRTWFLKATVDIGFLSNLVEGVRLGSTGEAYLVNRNGILQTRRRSGGQPTDLDADFNDCVRDGRSEAVFHAGKPWNCRYVYASRLLEHAGWILVVRQTVMDAYGALAVSIVISILVIVGGGGIVVAVLGIALTPEPSPPFRDRESGG